MTYTLTVEEAKGKLDELLPLQPDDIIILVKNGVISAKLIAAGSNAPHQRKPGSATGVIEYMAEDFDAPLEDFREYM